MINEIEFGNSKNVRKTLLITCFVGYSFESLVSFSTGNIEFLGFKIPVENAQVIPNLISYLIIYLTIVLIIRYLHEDLAKKIDALDKYQEKAKQGAHEIKLDTPIERYIAREFDKIQSKKIKFNRRAGLIYYFIIFIDLVFPIILSIYVLSKIFFD
ncbi:hypothetical protein [Ekhidna sp.]|uniref:hypothetical protein n=1 Tax=Ekhidna sp. TaxID=2608089 RepID=UPI003B5AF5F9